MIENDNDHFWRLKNKKPQKQIVFKRLGSYYKMFRKVLFEFCCFCDGNFEKKFKFSISNNHLRLVQKTNRNRCGTGNFGKYPEGFSSIH